MFKLRELAVVMGCVLAANASADVLTDAIAGGKTTLDLRLRAEAVDDSKLRDALATTLRTALGYKTAPVGGVTSFVEFENISALGADQYNNASVVPYANNQALYATVKDPAITQVNQAYLEGYGFKVGRQKVVLDNARFFGDVGWRQNDQTFDAVSYVNKMIPSAQITVDYLGRAFMIDGLKKTVSIPLLNVKYTGIKGVNLTAFWYGDKEDTALANSRQYEGLRADGKVGSFVFDVSSARQHNYDKGAVKAAEYRDLQIGWDFGPVVIKAQQEVLDSQFQTPYATLHAFNGWADRFLVTPAGGLVDTNLKLIAPNLSGFGVTLAGHRFNAYETSGSNADGKQAYGTEYDAQVSRKITDKFTVLAKVAYIRGEEGAPAPLPLDLTKAWLQVQYKY